MFPSVRNTRESQPNQNVMVAGSPPSRSSAPSERAILTGLRGKFIEKMNAAILNVPEIPPWLRPRDIFLAVLMEQVHEAYRREGVDLSKPEQIPDNLDDVLKAALLEVISTDFGRVASGKDKIDPALFAPKAKETLTSLHNDFHGTPLGLLSPQERMVAFLPEEKLATLRTMGVRVDDNPLIGFMHDREPEYLFGTVKARKFSMSNLNQPVGIKFLQDLYQKIGALESAKESRFDYDQEAGFVFPSSHLSEQGIEELVQFAEDVQKKLPRFSLDKIEENGEWAVLLKRPMCSPKTLEGIASGMIQTLPEPLRTLQKGTAFDVDEVERGAILFCQNMLRLHAEVNGNGRFAQALLNHFLMQIARLADPSSSKEGLQGMTLPLANMAGFSAEEVHELVKHNRQVFQERCAALSRAQNAPAPRINPLQQQYLARGA